mgnify:CR=1 FL=1
MYKGVIISESLEKPDLINDLEVLSSEISGNSNWHLYTVIVSRSDIKRISSVLKPEKYYAHFWNGDNVLVVFRNKQFEIKYSDKVTWRDAIEYGKSIGIPDKQLDFPIEG